MAEIKPFLCANIEKSLWRNELEKWLRSFNIYVDTEEISSVIKKRNKLLHLGGPQLQEVVYSLPGALVAYDATKENDEFTPLAHVSQHGARQGDCFAEFLLRLRQQASKCSFGASKTEIEEICVADKIIDAWAKTALKKKLLAELKLEEIINTCTVEEQVNQQSEAMVIPSDADIVKKIAVQTKRNDRTNDVCGRCGAADHDERSMACPARNSKCNKCSRFGHYARMCKIALKRRFGTPYDNQRKRPRTSQFQVRAIDEEETKCHSDNSWSNCFKITGEPEGEETVSCLVGRSQLQIIIDSGSRYNLISLRDWLQLNSVNATVFNVRNNSSTQFGAYASDDVLRVTNAFEAPIRIQERPEMIATFYVIENGRQSLLGRDTAVQLNVLKIGLGVNKVDSYAHFPKWKASPVRLAIDHNVRPVQKPMRRFPTALEDRIAERISQAVQQDIIEPVHGPSSWISPVVIAYKGSGEIRLCLDMRRANLALSRENYPLPTFDMFMTKLREARCFSRLDLKNAYHQLELDESSRQITTFITHKGLFRYKRLFFGVNSASEIAQRRLEELLAGCPNALNYIDDVIVFGKNEEEHDKALTAVLKIFDTHNVVLDKQKGVYKTTKLKFLGHILSDHGIEADPEKVKVITDFRDPKTKEETRSFLGLVTYVGKFIPDLANTTELLRRLIKANTKFDWTNKEQQAFDTLKKQVVEVTKLSYFNKNLRTCLIADASPVALGAVLRYSQTEKESLALVWAVEKFYYYLAGLQFDLITDHKPLESIFKPTSKPPARIERWLLRLQSYRFRVIYKAGKENIADSVSRLCQLTEAVAFDWQDEQIIFQIVAKGVSKSLTISEIMEKSMQDEEIIDAMTYLSTNSWEANSSSPYYLFRWELSTVENVLLRGTKIVIPTILRSQVLELAHEGHPGESAMKRRLRSKVWWPRIDREAEGFAKACRDCISVSLANFCRTNGITEITTPPYWPQANGEVENMNKSLVKRLKIAWSKVKDYKREIQNFVMMYNVTPHGTTEAAPSELMFNRIIRDKIPDVRDVVGDVGESSERDLDCWNKQKGKKKADKGRGAKASDIQPGDKIVLKNVLCPHKLTPTFDTTEYVVVNRKGNIVQVQGGGKTLTRDVSHLKKIPVTGTHEAATTTDSVQGPSTPRQTSQAPENEACAQDEGLKLKLKNIGGMWRPVPRELSAAGDQQTESPAAQATE
ncbi:uncharacterized protein LOC124459908 [Drosophila willistoni]|uniref:uncharacterized protein LOC124459908 n=1 Tax=Drosophila willistoni TaxID=7260 RepID=UPI001F0786AD|nr:uncharacterized protein LOC124459908 [Drosophila willistoni]